MATFKAKNELRALPSIDHGSETKLNNIDPTQHIIVQEKVDGSQFTITKQNGVLQFYNKNKQVSPKRGPWINVWLAIQGKEDMFQEGLYYHGEAFTDRHTNVVVYNRVPRYFWLVYKIVRQDNSILTPVEMHELLKGTGIELVQTLYDSQTEELHTKMGLQTIIDILLFKIGSFCEIQSCLGGKPEGIVVKVLNVPNAGKISNTRYKYVLPEFAEMHQEKRHRLPEVPDAQFIKELGLVYDTDARRQKAVQHLKEQERWTDGDTMKNIQAMVDELDNDLLKERVDEIKDMLLARFWKEISNSARGDVQAFLLNMK